MAGTTTPNSLQGIRADLERVRSRLLGVSASVDDNQQDARVQALADEFDRILNIYMEGIRKKA